MVWVPGYGLYGLLIEQISSAFFFLLGTSGFTGLSIPYIDFLAISGLCNTDDPRSYACIFCAVCIQRRFFFSCMG